MYLNLLRQKRRVKLTFKNFGINQLFFSKNERKKTAKNGAIGKRRKIGRKENY